MYPQQFMIPLVAISSFMKNVFFFFFIMDKVSKFESYLLFESNFKYLEKEVKLAQLFPV